MGEVDPNKFKKVVKVRSHTFEGLQMLLEGEGEWRSLDVTDYKFLLDEVQSAIRAIWE
jgi:expansin (peptidoglycan-binding protein)